MKKFIITLFVSLLICTQVDAMDNQDRLNNQLFDAAKTGNLEQLNQLIEAKADIDDRNYLYTPLIFAAENGHLSCVQALIAAKSNVNSPCNRGDTALIRAGYLNQLPCLQALIAAKADLNYSHLGQTALGWAADMYHYSICEALVEAMLYHANEKQKKAMIILLGLNKHHKLLHFLGLGKNFARTFKPHLCTAIYDQNKQDFQNSIAYQEVMKLKDGPVKKYLLEKYSNKPDTNTVNNANQNG